MSPSSSHLKRLLERRRYEEAFDELLPAISSRASTRVNTLSGWRNYAKWLEETGESLLSSAHPADDYLDWLRSQEAAPATLNNRLVQVRKLYALLLELGLVESNPFAGQRSDYNPVHERRQVYTQEEVSRLLAHADGGERLMVLLGADAGLSGREVRGLKFEDILEDGHALKVWRVRYREEGFAPSQVVRCSSAVRETLLRRMEERGAAPLYGQLPQGHLFEKEGRQLLDRELLATLYHLCQKANVEYKPWRALRHVAGIRRLTAGVDREEIQQTLGVQRLDPLLRKAGMEDGRRLRWKREKG